MRTLWAMDTAWVHKKIDRLLLTPDGLMAAVILILLSAFVLGGSGIDRRTMDGPDTETLRASVSPILSTLP